MHKLSFSWLPGTAWCNNSVKVNKIWKYTMKIKSDKNRRDNKTI